MTVLKLADRRDVRFAQLLGAQFGFGAASDVIDQLATQLSEFRLEREQQINELQARYDEQIAALKAELDRDLEALRGELAETRALIEALRALKA
jgi:ABC-type phosphate transport system auxiliary subunit